MLLRFPPQQHPWVCLQPRWRGFRRSTSTSCPAWRLSRQAPSRSSSHWRLGSGGRSTTNWRRASWGVSWWKNRARQPNPNFFGLPWRTPLYSRPATTRLRFEVIEGCLLVDTAAVGAGFSTHFNAKPANENSGARHLGGTRAPSGVIHRGTNCITIFCFSFSYFFPSPLGHSNCFMCQRFPFFPFQRQPGEESLTD